MLTDYQSEPMHCPGCDTELDGHLATKQGQTGPEDGGVSVCAFCATICVYTVTDGQLGLRLPTDDELDEILAEPRILQVIAALRVMREA